MRAAIATVAAFAAGACGSPELASESGARPDVLVSCETSDEPMYFTPRPTLIAPVTSGTDNLAPVRFEVYTGRPGESNEQFWADNLIERKATGVVVPAAVAGGRHAATWTVPVDLVTPSRVDLSVHVPTGFSWRTRTEPTTGSPTKWSRWRIFAVSLAIAPIRDCRLTADDIFWVFAYRSQRDRASLLDEYAHARRLREVFDKLRTRYPDEFTGAGDGHSAERPDSIEESGEWIVFRGPIPAKAAELLAHVRARPFDQGGGALEVLDRRGYNAAEERTRLRLAEAAAEATDLAFVVSAWIDSRTGVLHLEATRAGHDHNQDLELRRRIIDAIAAGTKLRAVPAEKNSRADASTLPVELRLGDHGDFGHG